MIKFYQNRELSEYLGIRLSRWKRWSREFLPPDPLGGMQSGYARQYNLNQAFTVYLGGHLVSVLRYSIPEAKQILIDLKEWVKEKEDQICGAGEQPEMPCVGEGPYCRLFVFKHPYPNNNDIEFLYLERITLSDEDCDQQPNGCRKEVYREKTINSPRSGDAGKRVVESIADPVFMDRIDSKILYITELYRRFLDKIE